MDPDEEELEGKKVENARSMHLDLKEKETIKKVLVDSKYFISLFTFWLNKSKLFLKIKSQIAGVLEKASSPECFFCGKKHGLKAEPINSIELQFKHFLKKEGYNVHNYSVDRWQNYFYENTVIRTVCYECFKEILPNENKSEVNETN